MSDPTPWQPPSVWKSMDSYTSESFAPHVVWVRAPNTEPTEAEYGWDEEHYDGWSDAWHLAGTLETLGFVPTEWCELNEFDPDEAIKLAQLDSVIARIRFDMTTLIQDTIDNLIISGIPRERISLMHDPRCSKTYVAVDGVPHAEFSLDLTGGAPDEPETVARR